MEVRRRGGGDCRQSSVPWSCRDGAAAAGRGGYGWAGGVQGGGVHGVTGWACAEVVELKVQVVNAVNRPCCAAFVVVEQKVKRG